MYTCVAQGVYKVAYNLNARSIQDCVQGRQGYYNNYIYIYIIYIIYIYIYCLCMSIQGY